MEKNKLVIVEMIGLEKYDEEIKTLKKLKEAEL
jgi:hypothetical protein